MGYKLLQRWGSMTYTHLCRLRGSRETGRMDPFSFAALHCAPPPRTTLGSLIGERPQGRESCADHPRRLERPSRLTTHRPWCRSPLSSAPLPPPARCARRHPSHGRSCPSGACLPSRVSTPRVCPGAALGVAAALDGPPAVACPDLWTEGRAPGLRHLGHTGPREHAALGDHLCPPPSVCPVADLARMAGGTTRASGDHAGGL